MFTVTTIPIFACLVESQSADILLFTTGFTEALKINGQDKLLHRIHQLDSFHPMDVSIRINVFVTSSLSLHECRRSD